MSSGARRRRSPTAPRGGPRCRSEEHTSELQSQSNLVCRLLLEKKKIQMKTTSTRSCCYFSHDTLIHMFFIPLRYKQCMQGQPSHLRGWSHDVMRVHFITASLSL